MRISVPSSMRATASSASATATALATAMHMKQQPHGVSTLLALLSLALLLLRLLLRLRLAAFRDAALSLHLLARLRLRPVLLRLHDGDHATTTVRVWCPATPSSKPPLLLLHGFGGDAKWTWARNLPRLTRHFHVYAPDLVFFGAQSRSASPLRSVAFQARCAAEAMRLLGVPRYDVAGISYGGFVAYRMAAAEARDAVGRLVIMTTGVAATPAEMRDMAAREDRTIEDALLPGTAEGLRLLVRRSMHRPPPWMPDFVLDDFIQLMYVDQKRERAELLHELLKNGSGFDTLPVLTQETLIIWGDKDQVFPIDLGHRLHKILGERSRLEIVRAQGTRCSWRAPTTSTASSSPSSWTSELGRALPLPLARAGSKMRAFPSEAQKQTKACSLSQVVALQSCNNVTPTVIKSSGRSGNDLHADVRPAATIMERRPSGRRGYRSVRSKLVCL